MRRLILAAALVAAAPLAFAQTGGGSMGRGGMGSMAPMSTPDNQGTMGGMHSAGPSGGGSGPMMGGQPDPNNCGTPDEPRRCPPMPRRAMNSYPENRQ